MTRMNEVAREDWLVEDGIGQLEPREKATCRAEPNCFCCYFRIVTTLHSGLC